MRRIGVVLGFAALPCLTSTPLYAGPHGRPANVKTTAVSNKPATPPTGKPAKHDSGSQSRPAVKSNTTTTTTTTAAPTSTTTRPNPIARKIASKPNQNAKITTMLPVRADGTRMSLNDASKGFKNQGQFIAALHASQRYNCGSASCFTLIKADMVDRHMSLGQSIQDVKKTASATSTGPVRQVEHEAEHDRGERHEFDREAGEQHETRHDDRGEHRRHDEVYGNKIARQIARNPQLAARVQALLPADVTLKKAAKGFGSERDFLAALHASKNLNIPFAQIKSEMTGHDRDSLTRAIRELKPAIDARAAARTARQEAAADLRASA